MSADITRVGWCHVCGRDITSVEDHAPGCEASDRGPEHREIAPTITTVVAVLEMTESEGIDTVLASVPAVVRVVSTHVPTPYADNCAAQDYLTAWAAQHLVEGDEDWDIVEGMIELLQETLGSEAQR